MAPTPSKSVQGQTTPLKTPQSKHRLHYNSIKNTHPSPNPTSAAKENPLAEHPVEVIGRIRDYPDQKDKPISGFHVSADHCTIRVQTDIGYRDFSLDGVSVSEEEDLDGFYKKFVKSRINGVKLGEKCTIMMYGPTGSGKSHTMFGCLKQPGIVYRALKDILGGSDAENDNESHDIGVGPFVQVTVLEIYNEEIYDLLSNNCGGGSGLAWPKGNSCKVKLEVMGKKAKNATFISGNEAGKISREVAKVEKRRIVKSTLCNDRSSRSHCVIILDVPTVGGRLMLVDMAGSENIEQAGQIGLEAKMQTGKINQGNIALKRVVESIANGDSHVPFRDSKLTMLLQDSFEDDKSKILMILCASPDPKEMHKTISTLEYGAKAKCIVRCGHTPNKDKVGFENSSSEVVLGSRIAAMDQFIFKLQMENKRREKERNEAHKELLRKEEEVAALRAKLEQVEERESAASEEEIDLKVKERTRVLKLELENKLQECQKMANEFVESERRRMEEKILQQQEEVEMLRQRLEEIESELCRSKENNGLQNIDEGTNFARRMLEIYGDGDRGMEKSMDLDMGDQQPTIVHDMKVVVEKETENFGNHTLFNSCVRNAMDEEDKFKEKVYLSTVFEEDEGEERESTEDEEVEKEVVEETAVQFGRRDINKADYNSLDHSDEKSQGLGLMDELENTKDPALTRKTRIQNIFMLCGNHRELAQHVRIPTPFKKRTEAADIQSSNAPEFGLQNRVLSDVTLRNTTKNPNSGLKEIFASLVNEKKSTEQELKENTRPYDENEDGLIEVYVKWEASKEYQGKFITKLNVVKDSSLADLRKLIETRLDDENSKQGFTFLMLGEPTGAPVMKEKEAIVQASKLPICNNQLGVHLACLRPIKAAQQPNHHFPFSPLENKLQVASNSPSTFMKKIEGFSPKLGQNLSPTPYVTTGLLYR